VAQFLLVYIHEAHPVDGVLPERQTGTWLMDSPERELLVEDPLTDDERLVLARVCEREMEPGFPVVVDRMDDAVNEAYAAWPERLYVVDIDGSVVYQGGKGPMDFAPDELEEVLAEMAAFYGDVPLPAQ
jgi:type I thyroxine 5'-deiodinase